MGHTKFSGIPAAPKAVTGLIFRINDFGLCELSVDGERVPFTFDKLQGYRGEQPTEVGLRVGVTVCLERDAQGRITTAQAKTPPVKAYSAAGS